MDCELRIIAVCANSTPALDLFRQALAAENAAGDVRHSLAPESFYSSCVHYSCPVRSCWLVVR